MSQRDSFVHLHLHTEYSMLDGASRIGDVVAAVAADGQPAVGITDHGNMYGALPMYTAAREAGVKPVLGMEGYFTNTSRFERPKRSEHEIYHLTMLAETNEGYRNLIKVTSSAYLDGYYYKPRSDWELLERHHDGHHRDERLPRRARVAADPRRRRAGRARGRRRASRTSSAATTSSSSCRTTASTTTCACSARCSTSRASCRRRCSRPTTATTRTSDDAEAHDALLCVQTGALQERRQALQVRRRRLLHQVGGRDARPVPRAARRVRQHAADRRARRRRDRVRPGDPAVVPGARRPRRELLPARAHDGGRAGALRRDARAARDRAHRARARRHQGDGVLRVLPRGVGPRALREVARDPGRPGAGERGRLVRRVLPAHRRRRPDQVRPAVRADAQPGPQADARHRHGLRLALPRRDDPVRRARSTATTTSRRSSRSPRSRRGPRCATRRGCSATPTSSATRSPS